ncbi:vWA domain-containing protein [Neobacillus sp. LXY-4]|uniref:vWA domain-containing protein n=1 Tax=Neobacillus sp. LXY-4 TaxID=3379826 RepID=UPI003EDFCF26
MVKKRTSSRLVILFIFLIFSSFNAQAKAPAASSSRIEGFLVVDVSKSMLESDPNKISNEAMKMFVDMSSLKGDKIGVIAYSDELRGKMDLVKLQNDEDKNKLKSFIDSLEKFPNTDLSVGLKEAVNNLNNSHEKGYRPLIVLLADGNNDLNENKGKTPEQATDELNATVADAKAKGYPIYVIGLNANNDLNKDILLNIATETKGKFFETSNADDLPVILSEIFAKHTKSKMVSINENVGNGEYQDIAITIPNSNVLEANISLLSNKEVELKLVDPKGKERQIPSDNILLSKSKAYSILKLLNPVQGEWTLKVKGSPEDIVDIDVVLNYDLQLKLAPVNTEGLSEGDRVKITAFFEDNGKQINSKDLYESMQATLSVKELSTGETKNVRLSPSKQGFTGEFQIGQSTNYEITVNAEGDSFYREIQPQSISFQKGSNSIKTSISGFPKSPSLYLALIVLLAFPALFYSNKKRKKNRGFNGQVIVEIKNEATGECSKQTLKEFKGLKEEFTLNQMFSLAPEFTETEKITFIPLTENALLLFNKSNLTIERNGVVIDLDTFHRFRRNEQLRIRFKDLDQSIYVKFVS